MKRPLNRWIVLAVVTVAGFLADWGTKALALDAFREGVLTPFLGDVAQWTLSYNPGSLFGLTPAALVPGLPPLVFYLVFTVLELAFVAWFFRRLDDTTQRLSIWALALVVPGALGNLLDRILGRPGVVDFIRVDLGFWPFHPWPTFNVADIWITVGLILLAIDMIRHDVRQARLRKAGADAPAPVPPARRRK